MKKILVEKSRYHKYAFEFGFSYETLDFCRHLKKKYGWRSFGFLEDKWRFSNPIIAEKLQVRYKDIEIDTAILAEVEKEKLRLRADKILVDQANEIKKKTTSDLQIKNLKLELYPYQLVGVEFFINNNGKAILADTMGLGKTAQALAYIVHEKIAKTLVVSPSSVKYSWEKEVGKWTKLKALVITSKSQLTPTDFSNHDIFIVNYEILKKFFDILTTIRFDCIVFDEFHYIKNAKAQRTKVSKKIAGLISKCLLLSGTPLLSRPAELFTGLHLMDPVKWKDYYEYTARYCNGHLGSWGWDCSGSSNIKELKNNISRYFLRRRKEEVLPELPAKSLVRLPVELTVEKKFEYDLVMSSLEEYLQSVKNKPKNEIDKSMRAEQLVKLNALRQITTQGKIEAANDMINNILDAGEKVVVFSWYNEPLESLYEKFKDKAVMLTGKTPESEKKIVEHRFQTEDDIKIFFGGIKSAGVGLTLTAGQNVVFIDYSWVPADHDQAADRIHRIGQTAKSIFVYQLYAKDTIDEKMIEMLEAKSKIFKKLIDEDTEAAPDEHSLVNDLIDDISENIWQ